ncbi:MAG: glycosyltransferase family 2 protein [Candidatus Bathyarchaeia archaeon]
MSRDPLVSVIIPTRNERESIAECVEKARRALEEMGLAGEVIVSDNSSDDTPEIARGKGAIVVHPDRLGYGYAYIYALRHAKGRYIVMADGDGTYDLSEMPNLLEPLLKGEADVVLGTRIKGRIMPGAMPWLHRHIGNPLLTYVLNRFHGTRVSDAHTGFRAFTREALEKIKPTTTGMEFASELIIKAAYAGLRIKEVPITYYPRRGGQSKLRSFRDGWRHLKLILTFAPKFLYYIPGAAMMLAGVVFMLAALLRIHLGYSPGIHSSILGSMLSILGFNLATLGLITDTYLASLLGRPTSSITNAILRRVSIEKVALLGALLSLTGLTYLLRIFTAWVESGYRYIPVRGENVVASTLLILGFQTILQTFTLHLLSAAVSEQHASGAD